MLVGYGSEPGECVRIVREKFLGCLLGNHEHLNRGCDELRAVVGWPLKIPRRQLAKDKTWLRTLPLVLNKDDMMLVHASPWRPETFSYVHNDEDANASFETMDAKVAFIRHTHLPAIWKMHREELRQTVPGDVPVQLHKGSRYIVNVGSVGQPRDDNPRACYAVYDCERRVVRFRHVAYDIPKAQERFLNAGLASWSASRLEAGE